MCFEIESGSTKGGRKYKELDKAENIKNQIRYKSICKLSGLTFTYSNDKSLSNNIREIQIRFYFISSFQNLLVKSEEMREWW